MKHPQIIRKIENYSIVAGRNPIRQLIEKSPNRVHKILVMDGADSMDAVGKNLLDLIISKKIEFTFTPKQVLLNYATSPQGFVALVHPKNYLDINSLELLASSINQGVIVAIDSVKDPQNLGSILRACDCFGVKAVVWSKNRSVSITEVVSKVSAGASEFIPCAQVSNLREALKRLKKLGFSIVSTVIDPSSISLNDYTFLPKSVIILGGESDGIQPLIAKESDQTIYIPVKGVVDSLNVGQALAVVLYAYIDSMQKLK